MPFHEAALFEGAQMLRQAKRREMQPHLQIRQTAWTFQKGPNDGYAAFMGKAVGNRAHLGIAAGRVALQRGLDGFEQRCGGWNLGIGLHAIDERAAAARGFEQAAGLNPAQFLTGASALDADCRPQIAHIEARMIIELPQQLNAAIACEHLACSPEGGIQQERGMLHVAAHSSRRGSFRKQLFANNCNRVVDRRMGGVLA